MKDWGTIYDEIQTDNGRRWLLRNHFPVAYIERRKVYRYKYYEKFDENAVNEWSGWYCKAKGRRKR